MGIEGVTVTALPLLLSLVLVQLLGDFVFQPAKWVDDRYVKHQRSAPLYGHAAVHGVLAFIVLWVLCELSYQVLIVTALIAATHFFIDLIKSFTCRNQLRWFAADQLMHFMVVGIVWLWLTQQWFLIEQIVPLLLDEKLLLVLAGYGVVLWPFSHVVALICGRWTDDTIRNADSLSNAGKWLGQLERFLILTFILIGQFAAIGFLLAGKSILRFSNAQQDNQRKINEYVLLGTLTSFTITIIFGLMLKCLLKSF